MTTLVEVAETQSQKAVTVNENFYAVAPAGLFGVKLSTSVGLTWNYYGGYMLVAGVLTAIAAGTLTLSDNLDNYIEANTSGTVFCNVGSPSGFTAGRIPLYIVQTSSGLVSSYTDCRNFALQPLPQDPGGPKRWITYPALASLSDGTSSTPVNGTRYWCSLYIPHRVRLTGISYLIGGTGGTDKVIVELKDAYGASLANSALAGATVGTANTFQPVAFTAGLFVDPGWYYVVVQMNGTTARLRTIPANLGISQVANTGSAAGTFGTVAAITPPTGFTADVGPIAYVY
jgi:hypothetical protein